MTSEYRYRGRDVKDVKERAEQQGGSWDRYTDTAIPTLRVGKAHTLRILPPPYDIDIDKWGKNWSIKIFLHYGVGPDKGSYLCLQKMEHGDCPICEARAEQNLAEGEQDPLKPTVRYLCYVIDRENERDGPMLWTLPWTIERDIQNLSLDAKEGLLEIDHPEHGYDVSFSREGKGIQTKWSGLKIARRTSPLHDNPKTVKAWLAFIEDNPLPETLHFESYKYIDKVYRAQTPKKDDERRRAPDADDDDRPANRSRKSRADPDDGERPASRAHEERRGRDDAEEGRSRRAPERAGRHSDDAEAEDIPDQVHRRTRSQADEDDDDGPARPARDYQTRREARAADPDEDDKTTRSRNGEEKEADVPAAKTRADIAREQVNRLKSGADKDGKSDGKPDRNEGRPQRRRSRDDDDSVPY